MPLTQTVLDMMDANCSQSVSRLFYMMTQTNPTTVLPRKLRQSKALCAKTFKARLVQLKNPLCDWAHHHVSANGTVGWADGGCYKLTWEGEGSEAKATRVTYICGNSAAKVSVHITKDFELHDAWDSFKARAEKKPARYFMHEFFGDDGGPNLHKDASAKHICVIIVNRILYNMSLDYNRS